jgi:hypothetical protein
LGDTPDYSPENTFLVRFRSLPTEVPADAGTTDAGNGETEGDPEALSMSRVRRQEEASRLEARKGFEFGLGLQLPLLNAKRPLTVPGHLVRVSAVAELGGVTTSDTTRTNGFLLRTFFGLQLQNVGHSSNGSYVKLGYGKSENFLEEQWRWKAEGYFTIFPTQTGAFFFAGRIETDLGEHPDEVTIILGRFIPARSVIDALESLIS